jgi:hypothetical protein
LKSIGSLAAAGGTHDRKGLSKNSFFVFPRKIRHIQE